MKAEDEASSTPSGGRAALRRRVADRVYTTYAQLYAQMAGDHPDLRRWHWQWLAHDIVVRDLQPELGRLTGRVLDVGCGHKPYGRWLTGADAHVGLDVAPSPEADVVVDADEPWPFPDASFDAIVCTQVLEHTRSPERVVAEMRRVLRPGGRFVVTVPSIYNVHGVPHDYRRWTTYGVTELLSGLEVFEARPQGAIGSSAGVLVLNWLDVQLRASAARVLALTLMLPLWVLLCAAVNVAATGLDRIDSTALFYGNVLACGRRPL